jgi:hypothetical protein
MRGARRRSAQAAGMGAIAHRGGRRGVDPAARARFGGEGPRVGGRALEALERDDRRVKMRTASMAMSLR